MMSSRQQLSPGTGTMPPISGDADFGSCYTSTHHPYAAFDGSPSAAVDHRPPLLHHHHQQLYDTTGLDYAALFPFAPQQDNNPPAHLFPNQLPPFTANSTTMLLQPPMLTPLPGLPTSSPPPAPGDAYQLHHPFGGFQLKRENEGGLFPFSDAMAASGVSGVGGGSGGRIGLNLGRRTYFSPADVLAVDRLLMRTRGGLGGGGMGVLGLGLGGGIMQQPPRCQAEGCKADLSAAKHYHRRHKVCEYHAKAAAVAANGKQQRFCQQCSRFHVLAEFDEAKRSCRKRLTEHNRRRRKPVGVQGKDSPPPPPSKKLEAGITTSSYAGDHTTTNKSSSTAAAAVLSPSASAFSCLQQQEEELDDNNEGSGGRPTTLSLAAPPQRDYGGALDTMLLMHHHHHQAAAAVVQDDDQEQDFMMTSLVQSHHHHQQQQQQGEVSGNILSCSPTASDQRRQNHQQMQINDGGDDSGCCNNSGMQQQQHFFEVDFM